MKLSIKEVLALEEITEIDCPTRASTVLSIILAPYERKTFYSDYWEKRPMHCANDGDKKKAVKGLLSSKQFRNILKSQSVLYGQDITTSRMRADQMSGKDDDNEELIEAKEKDLWQQVEEGCSLRLLSPQKFHDPLWSLLSCLEFEFGHKVSCYVDFLPPGIPFF
jgi:lysine-specific demethylase/histidyl-hydroxylase NO66